MLAIYYIGKRKLKRWAINLVAKKTEKEIHTHTHTHTHTFEVTG
jgi:hypothetical protein